MARLAAASFVAAMTLLVGPSVARADTHEWRQESGEAHGSQVSSSEWLPIILGGAGGLILGGVVGQSFDDHHPPVAGGLVGAGIGAVAGGAGGAWIIRTIRDRDPRVPGLLTGLSLGAGLGVIMFNQMGDSEGNTLHGIGKWSSLVVFPAVGAVVGWKLATLWGGKAATDAPQTGIAPMVSPIVTSQGATGLSIGATAIF